MKFSRDRFFFLLLMHLSVYQVKADTLTVCPDCQVRSLVQAIKESRSGDYIFVMGGVYSEGKIDICKRVSLIGFNYPQILGNDSTDIFLVNADSVITQGISYPGYRKKPC